MSFTLHKCHLSLLDPPHILLSPSRPPFPKGWFVKLNGKSGPYLAEGDASGCFCKLEVPDN